MEKLANNVSATKNRLPIRSFGLHHEAESQIEALCHPRSPANRATKALQGVEDLALGVREGHRCLRPRQRQGRHRSGEGGGC